MLHLTGRWVTKQRRKTAPSSLPSHLAVTLSLRVPLSCCSMCSVISPHKRLIWAAGQLPLSGPALHPLTQPLEDPPGPAGEGEVPVWWRVTDRAGGGGGGRRRSGLLKPGADSLSPPPALHLCASLRCSADVDEHRAVTCCLQLVHSLMLLCSCRPEGVWPDVTKRHLWTNVSTGHILFFTNFWSTLQHTHTQLLVHVIWTICRRIIALWFCFLAVVTMMFPLTREAPVSKLQIQSVTLYHQSQSPQLSSAQRLFLDVLNSLIPPHSAVVTGLLPLWLCVFVRV